MKKKTITLVVYMLVCISLVSVGFAAWIITGGDETHTSGNVTATTVTDKSLSVTNEAWVDGKDSIHFGAPKELPDTDYKWLQSAATDATDYENLSVTYSFTLSTGSPLGEAVYKVNGSFTAPDFTFEKDEEELNLVTLGYVTEATISAKVGNVTIDPTSNSDDFISDLEAAIQDVEANSVDIQITISCDWGLAFGGDNPYEFFNAQAGGTEYKGTYYKGGITKPTYKDFALEALTNLQTGLPLATAKGFAINLEFLELDSKPAQNN